MHHDYLEDWKDNLHQLQRPLREMVELNVKTLQRISYLKPDELAHLKKPEDLLEKNVHLFIQNSHKALDYFQEAFDIFERNLLSLTKEIRRSGYKHH